MAQQDVQLGLSSLPQSHLEALMDPKTTSDASLTSMLIGSTLAGPQQSDEAASILPYLQGMDTAEIQKVAKSLAGAENEPDAPDYALPMMSLGLALMSQPGDFVTALGKAGLQALPQFQAVQTEHRQAVKQREQNIQNLTQQLMLQDAASQRDNVIKTRAAKAASQSKTQEQLVNYMLDVRKEKIKAGIVSPKDRYMVEQGRVIDLMAPGGPKVHMTLDKPVKLKDQYLSQGNALIDLKVLKETGDYAKATVGTVADSSDATADAKNFAQLVSLQSEARKEKDPEKKKILEQQASQFANMTGANKSGGNVTVMRLDADGQPQFIQGPAGSVEEGLGTIMDDKRAAELEASYAANRNIADLTTELIIRTDRSALTYGGAGEVAGWFAGLDAAARDILGENGNAEVQQLTGGVDTEYLKKLQGDTSLSEAQRSAVRSLSNQSQQNQSIGIRLAFMTAKANDPRVTDKDFAAAVLQVGLGQDKFFTDPERVRTGLTTNLNAQIKQFDVDWDLKGDKDKDNPIRSYVEKLGYEPADRRGNYKYTGAMIDDLDQQLPTRAAPVAPAQLQQAASLYSQLQNPTPAQTQQFIRGLQAQNPALAAEFEKSLQRPLTR